MNRLIFIISLFGLMSCQSENISEKQDCDQLSMNCYKGKPNDCYALKKYCSDTEYQYTNEKCQNAFNGLMMGATKEALSTQYGERILECFTSDQIDKYLK